MDQRPGADIVAVGMQKIEGKEHQPEGAAWLHEEIKFDGYRMRMHG